MVQKVISAPLRNNLIVKISRFYCEQNLKKKIRVRFAPSPTGYLHLGGLRTALYNYLFAKANNGTFILRIEDTDQTRLVGDSVKELENDLAWAGLSPDEGPSKGGAFGPYTQSQRLPLYRQYAKILVEKGAAYPCFCSPRRLELLRRDAIRTRQIPRYDNRCRSFSDVEVQQRINNNEAHCIRLKMYPGNGWVDAVLGPLSPDPSVEGDPVLLKTDGFPTYHLANVVDDYSMEVSHVLRGVEWQISTPKHLQIYKALGWSPPVFGHLPLLLNPDGSKLSKRQGGVTVREQRDSGVLPRALLAWLTQAGGGFVRAPGALGPGPGAPRSLDDLARDFELTRVHSGNCRLPLDLLPSFNRAEIERLLGDDAEAAGLVGELRRLVDERYRGRPEAVCLQLEEAHVLQVLRWAVPRISRLSDLLAPDLLFLWERPPPLSTATPDDIRALRLMRDDLAALPPDVFHKERLATELRAAAQRLRVPFGRLMRLLRTALSGRQEGPAVAEILAVLGPQVALTRLDAATISNSN